MQDPLVSQLSLAFNTLSHAELDQWIAKAMQSNRIPMLNMWKFLHLRKCFYKVRFGGEILDSGVCVHEVYS